MRVRVYCPVHGEYEPNELGCPGCVLDTWNATVDERRDDEDLTPFPSLHAAGLAVIQVRDRIARTDVFRGEYDAVKHKYTQTALSLLEVAAAHIWLAAKR